MADAIHKRSQLRVIPISRAAQAAAAGGLPMPLCMPPCSHQQLSSRSQLLHSCLTADCPRPCSSHERHAGPFESVRAESQNSPLRELVHQDVGAVLQVKGPGQVVDCLGCLVSMAGALGGAVACGQRLAGVPGEERVPVLRLRGGRQDSWRGCSRACGILT